LTFLLRFLCLFLASASAGRPNALKPNNPARLRRVRPDANDARGVHG
jgi:hypothetical protein